MVAADWWWRPRRCGPPVGHPCQGAGQPTQGRAGAARVPALAAIYSSMTTRALTSAELGLRGRQNFHLAGNLPPPPRLAVIGSRAARHDRIALLEAVARAAAGAGMSLVSGGAVGIDAAAHRAALAADLPQLAVLPCGSDRPYPPHHVPLFRSIAEARGSGLLYCHPPGTATCRAMFVSRNIVVLGLAQAVLIVEARTRSGSHGTGRAALRRGQPVAAVLGSSGCADLVGRGARGLPPEPAAFAERLGSWLAQLSGEPPAAGPSWPEHLRWLDEALERAGEGGICLDELDRPLERIIDLLAAERAGLIVEAPQGCYRRVR
jgi:DNA protecting protein DprA